MKEQLNTAFNLLTDKLISWFNAIIENIPNMLLALLVMVVSYYTARYVSRLITRLISKKVQQKSITTIIARLTTIIVVGIGFFLALGILNLSETLKTVITGAGVAGLVIGLALQGTLSNTVAGIVLSFKKKIQIGNWVETSGYAGKVLEISLKNFIIKEADNNIVLIPNKSILENSIKNYSLTPNMKIMINCGVGYESDLEQVETVAKEAIANAFETIEKPEDVEFYYEEFGDSSINFLCRFWHKAENAIERISAKSKAIKAIKTAFDSEGINIPFPIRTLEFNNNLAIAKTEQVEKSFSDN